MHRILSSILSNIFQFAAHIVRKTQKQFSIIAPRRQFLALSTIMMVKNGVISTMMLVVAGIAQAEELPGATEWRVMGPAFSRHLSLDGAAIEQPATAPGSAEVKRWNENNPAFGLMRTTRNSEGVGTQYFGQLVKDSYGKMGVMIGAGYSWPLFESESFKAEWGFAAGLWYRTFAKNDAKHTSYTIKHMHPRGYPTSTEEVSWSYEVTELKRAWIPFVLPVASLEHKNSGIGLTVSFVPKVAIGGKKISPANTILFQTTYRF